MYRPLVEQYQWDTTIAMAVMQAESGCDPNRPNRQDVHKDSNGKVICIGSFGLFQISCHDGEVYDPDQNVSIAWRKYQARGWQPWGAYSDGRYLNFLK